MLLPVWILLCILMFVCSRSCREPNGPIAMWLTSFAFGPNWSAC